MRSERWSPHAPAAPVASLLTLLPWLGWAPEAQGQVLRGHTDLVMSVAFSPDGKTLATAGVDKTVRLWNVATGKQQAVLREKGEVMKVAFTPDGKYLLAVVGAEEDTIKVWDVAKRKEKARFACARDSNPLAVSPDGKSFTSNGPDHAVQLRDIETGKVIVTFRGHTDMVRGAAFSRDGKVLVTAARDSTIRAWDPGTGKMRSSIKQDAHAVAISPDGKTIASSWVLKEVQLWERATGKETGAIKRDQHVFPLTFFPDGKVLAAGFDDALVLLDGSTAKRLKKLPIGFVSAVGVSADGKYLAAVGPDKAKSVRLWRTADVLPKPVDSPKGKEGR